MDGAVIYNATLRTGACFFTVSLLGSCLLKLLGDARTVDKDFFVSEISRTVWASLTAKVLVFDDPNRMKS